MRKGLSIRHRVFTAPLRKFWDITGEGKVHIETQPDGGLNIQVGYPPPMTTAEAMAEVRRIVRASGVSVSDLTIPAYLRKAAGEGFPATKDEAEEPDPLLVMQTGSEEEGALRVEVLKDRRKKT